MLGVSPVLSRRRLQRRLHLGEPLPPVFVLMDESGNGNKDRPLIVGAACADREFHDLENNVRSLYRQYEAQERRFGGTESFESFVKQGFHGGQMPLEIQLAFNEFLAGRLDFKIFMVVTNRDRMADLLEDRRIVLLYFILITDIIIRYRRHSAIHIQIEQNDALKPHIAEIASKARERAARKSSLPIAASVQAEMVPKKEPLSLGIIDFYMLTTSKWLMKGAPRNRESAEYRNFVALESSISFLMSMEDGVLSNRSARVAP